MTAPRIPLDQDYYDDSESAPLWHQCVRDGKALLQRIEDRRELKGLSRLEASWDEAGRVAKEITVFYDRYHFRSPFKTPPDLPLRFEEDSSKTAEVVEQCGIQPDKMDQRAYLPIAANVTSVRYVADNHVDSAKGTIICAYNWAKHDIKVPGYETLRSSALIFQQYRQHAAIAADQHLKLDRLKYVLRYEVVNEATKVILRQACPGLEHSRSLTEPVTFPAGDSAFEALLATPNGKAVAFIVKDYFESLGRKTIDEVKVWHSTKVGWCVLFCLGGEDPPRSALEKKASDGLDRIRYTNRKSSGHKKAKSSASNRLSPQANWHHRSASTDF